MISATDTFRQILPPGIIDRRAEYEIKKSQKRVDFLRDTVGGLTEQESLLELRRYDHEDELRVRQGRYFQDCWRRGTTPARDRLFVAFKMLCSKL